MSQFLIAGRNTSKLLASIEESFHLLAQFILVLIGSMASLLLLFGGITGLMPFSRHSGSEMVTVICFIHHPVSRYSSEGMLKNGIKSWGIIALSSCEQKILHLLILQPAWILEKIPRENVPEPVRRARRFFLCPGCMLMGTDNRTVNKDMLRDFTLI